MIAIPKPPWHSVFLSFLPTVQRYARIAFHGRKDKEDLVSDVVANVLVAVVRLNDRGLLSLCYPTVLAMYAIKQVRSHRRIGAKLNVRDVLSTYAQRSKGFRVERLDQFDSEENSWMEAIVEDRHTGPADTAAVRIDFDAWLRSLSSRNRRIALALASNERTGAVARRFRVSPGRVSQLRLELKTDWEQFIGGPNGST